MGDLRKFGKVYSTDVLVIGGGMAGLPAALEARENDAEVIIVEKGFTGLSGQAPRGGNGILAMPKDADYEAYEEFVCTIGDYLNDQEALHKFAHMINPSLHKLDEWGATLSKYDNGEIAIFPFEGSPMYNTGINLFALDNLRKTAVKQGIKTVDHTFVTSLIKQDNVVCGAVGFDVFDGEFIIFLAKSVIVACGSNSYRATRMFTGSGEGMILAYDAGAQMRNAEFNFIEVGAKVTGETIHNGYFFTKNKNGENVWEKYVHWNAQDVCPEYLEGIAIEYQEGRGPVYIDLEEMYASPIWQAMARGQEGGPAKLFPDKLSWMKRLDEREGEYIELGSKPPVTFAIHGNNGFIRVDKDMRTTLKGLYSAGADTDLGSAILGGAPLPAGQRGGAFMYCTVTGRIAGENAAIEAKKTNIAEDLPDSYINELKEFTYRGYQKNEGSDINIRQLLDSIQEAACKYDVIFRKTETSLKKALIKIANLEKQLEKYNASDWHELKLFHEAYSLLKTSEIAITCGLERKETRGFHRREDYPKRNDEIGLKWTLADKVDGKVKVSFEDIPIKKYKFEPKNIKGYDGSVY